MKILDTIAVIVCLFILSWIVVYSATSVAIREHSRRDEGVISATSTTAIVQNCTSIDLPIYNTHISVRHSDIDAGGRFYGYGTDGPYIIEIDNVALETFAHESTHAMQAIVKSRGIDDIEAEAYLVGHITSELTKCFNLD